MPWARSQEGPASLLLGWFAPKKRADSHPFTDPGRGKAENEEPPAHPEGGGEECRGRSEAGSKAQSGRGGQWAWALMPSEDHEMGLFPQKKKTENKQTTGKASQQSHHSGWIRNWGWGVIHKGGHLGHCTRSSSVLVGLPLGSSDSRPNSLPLAPAAFPEAHITCHPPGGKSRRPRAWEGQPQSRAQV